MPASPGSGHSRSPRRTGGTRRRPGGGRRGLAKRTGPEIDDLVRLYLRASAHLAEVRTRYRDPRLEAYLNRVVGVAHSALYGSRARSWRQVIKLFGPRYRLAARRTLPFILVAAAVMVVVSGVVEVWVAGSREVQAGLLPPLARDAVQRAGGHRPDLGVAPAGLSAFIFINNVRVALLSFVAGLALGIGSVYFVAQNGLLQCRRRPAPMLPPAEGDPLATGSPAT